MLSINFWITLLVVLWIYVLWSRRKYYKLMMQIPGPIGYPIFGNLNHLLNNKVLQRLGDAIQIYGSSWLGWFGPVPVLFLSDPTLIQEILSSPYSLNKSQIAYNIVADILGDGLVAINDPEWREHRKIINPAFGHKALTSYKTIFNSEGSSLIRELDNLVGQGEKELLSIFKNYSLRIATQTTLGTDVKKDEVIQNGTLLAKYQSALEVGTVLFLKPWNTLSCVRKLNGLQKILDDSKYVTRKFIKKMINNAIEKDSKHGKAGSMSNNFINLAIAQWKEQVFSIQNIEDEANAVVFAAFETTALTINYSLMHLAMFPEYQERVFEEIKSVFPDTGDFDVTYEDIQKLEYLEMVINESMRLMPAIPISLRKATEDIRLSNGVVLPKGLQFCISIFHTHRNKDIWGPDAEMFNPDNCLPRSLQDKHSYALMPFLKGKRNCPGWKYGLILLKITMIKIFRNYKISTSFRYEDLAVADNITLKVKHLPGLRLERRS